jgi:DNA-binding IclR family transcriptional regulator
VVLDKAEGTGFLRAAPRLGSSVPVHATAVGKLYLAFGDGAVAPPALPYPRFSARTAVDAAALRKEVERARTRGFAENRDEWIPGLSVVAAPVLAVGRLQGVIAVAAGSERMRELGVAAVATRARAAAGRVADRLEGRAQ